jgi:geranylgeranyl diphosphate synthase type II
MMPTDTGPVIEEHLRHVRAEVERHLDRVLGPAPGVPPRLLEAMRYSVLGPGKRLRPVLTVLSARACASGTGGTPVGVNPWPAACAVELIHAYSLIHDDLPAMDDDDLRRGRPTCHKQFGEALAILAGDALQALAFQALAEGYPPEVAGRCMGELARAAGAAGMVGGQADDLAWEDRTSRALPTVEVLEGIHLRKTGALIRAACVLGAMAAGAPRDAVAALDGYGRSLGLAFQVVDDLLDVEGDAGTAGKRLRKDAARGKLTYPGLLGVEESRRRARRLGEEAREHLAALALSESAGLGEVERLHDLVTLVLARDS